MVAVNFGLHNPGNIGLELDIVDEEELAILSHRDLEVALVGTLLEVAGIEAEDAGGVGGEEVDGGVVAIVVAIDGEVDLAARRGELDGLVVAHGSLDNGVGALNIVESEVERDINQVDGVVGKETHFDTLGRGAECKEEEAEYGEGVFHFCAMRLMISAAVRSEAPALPSREWTRA